MKRDAGSCAKPLAAEMVRVASEQVANTSDVSNLLREIRDELRQNNTLLQKIQPVVPSAPSDLEVV